VALVRLDGILVAAQTHRWIGATCPHAAAWGPECLALAPTLQRGSVATPL